MISPDGLVLLGCEFFFLNLSQIMFSSYGPTGPFGPLGKAGMIPHRYIGTTPSSTVSVLPLFPSHFLIHLSSLIRIIGAFPLLIPPVSMARMVHLAKQALYQPLRITIRCIISRSTPTGTTTSTST
jgi:hypothetical protein